MSSSPHSTSRSICSSALITIGPRQIVGVSSATMNPIDMHLMPWLTSGIRVLPSLVWGLPWIAIMRGSDGP